MQLLRWIRQFVALTEKDFLIFWRRPWYLFATLLLPGLCLLNFFVGNLAISNNDSPPLYPNQVPSYLSGLGSCEAYDSSNCVPVAFAPENAFTTQMMKFVANKTNLLYDQEILPFQQVEDLKLFVAEHLGQVQFSVFFVNQSLWYENTPNSLTGSGNHSYVIYYNVTQESDDPRSTYHRVNFPMLVLQQTLEEGLLRWQYQQSHPSFLWNDESLLYEATFAQTWSFNVNQQQISNTTFTCNSLDKDMGQTSSSAPWVFIYIFQMIGLLAFQVLHEERHKGLLQSLRTLGLFHSAYWISWMLFFQVLAILAAMFGLLVAAILRPYVYVLEHLDSGPLFLFLWFGMSCSTANAMWLASFTPQGNSQSVIVLFNFLVALLTMVFTGSKLNQEAIFVQLSSSAQSYQLQCLPTASGYNEVFKTSTGMDLVQFIIFWMPWFHIGRVVNEFLSVIQFGQRYSESQMVKHIEYYETTIDPTSFTAESVSFTFGMMVLLSVVYLILAWLCEQLVAGIPLEVIVIPAGVRRYLDGVSDDRMPLAGDYRGQERRKSREEESIRAYKVSKTYVTVQALKEVSFQIQKGEVFCLLG